MMEFLVIEFLCEAVNTEYWILNIFVKEEWTLRDFSNLQWDFANRTLEVESWRIYEYLLFGVYG
jgi:hypothetical protein